MSDVYVVDNTFWSNVCYIDGPVRESLDSVFDILLCVDLAGVLVNQSAADRRGYDMYTNMYLPVHYCPLPVTLAYDVLLLYQLPYIISYWIYTL